LQNVLEAVYRQWRGVLWRWQVLLSCKLINKCLKKRLWFLFGQTAYVPFTVYMLQAWVQILYKQ
jgi:hypothetical protein